MALPLESKCALVTGASKGIGKAIAIELARRGAKVAVNYFSDASGADAAVREIQEFGGEAAAVQANVGSAAEASRMFSETLNRFAGLDILVNNAGTQVWGPLVDVTEEQWDRVIDTNLKGCFLCTQHAARHMMARGGGRIINIGSGCNKAPFPMLSAYTASKGGIEMFTKVAAMEFGPHRITVNCVAPGAIEIERTKSEAPDYAATWAGLTPLARVGQPLDVAQAVAFFASAEAGFITGQTLWVDGGLMTHPQWPYKTE
ncbi:MAG TPA: 3-oxoacyl-ACP reductase family protein [Bryobacteraceae bacterium]|jgi:NAD(P)-dependent dehydrogenase (short-subunit alcohol dehydrogenase family)|nr:3-oxoacyl-ACP reductase family protein [Bryobacteraceae bacterium]